MLDILYEDNHIIAVNKPATLLVQGDKTGDIPLLELVKAYIKEKYNKQGEVFLGLAHRIDRPTSGVVIFARTSKALARINKLFQEKKVQKTYWAVVKNKPQKKQDTLRHYLLKNQKLNKSFASDQPKGKAKESSLTYKVVGETDFYTFLEITPHTGRHHQIRVQLSAIGFPIKGDLKYGFDRSNKDASIHLHAREVEFIHPVQKTPLKITAVPNINDALWKEFNSLA